MASYSESVSQQQQQHTYSNSQKITVDDPRFTNILNTAQNRREIPGTISEDENKIDFIPKSVAVILGSTYFLIILCILLVLPILEVAIGAAYRNQCPINPNIPVYLIVTGACGIASIALTIALVVVFIFCIKKSSNAIAVASGCVIVLVFIIIFLMSLFLFAWFIAGNVWIFGAKKTVDLDNPLSSNYCHRTLYQFAFVILILTYVMIGISCCRSCIQTCIQAGKSAKK